MKTKLLLLITSFFVSMNSYAVSVNYGSATDQNQRPYQEDRHRYASIRDSRGEKRGNFFGIYDGHGGDKTATLLQQHLHEDFAQRLRAKRSIKSSFVSAVLKNDNRALHNYSDGSTALAVYLDNSTNILHYAWAGDTRLAVHAGPATQDHKPDSPQEKERIEKAGGKIELYGVPRVNGLAVARSIGDKPIKRAGKGQVIATPEYGQYQLTKDNEFMILASDGLWDTVDNEKALYLVKNALKKGDSCRAAAHTLKNEAIKRGSGDNITVMVVQFDWNKK